jgi:hypothetical protein
MVPDYSLASQKKRLPTTNETLPKPGLELGPGSLVNRHFGGKARGIRWAGDPFSPKRARPACGATSQVTIVALDQGLPMIRIRIFLFLTFALMLCVVPRVQAAESYDNCTGFITSLPAVISTQGIWCLKQDLATAITGGYAIDIQTNNVTLDCNNFKLGGLAAGPSSNAYGINSENHLNATVRNCNVRGFNIGVIIYNTFGGGGHVIEDNRVEGNLFWGILVKGDGSVVRRNQVLNTGGFTIVGSAFGIEADLSVDVLDNTVSGVAATSGSGHDATGIKTSNNLDGSVSGNRVRGVSGDGAGRSYGIYNADNAGRIVVRRNDVSGNASANSIGLYCPNTFGIAKDNVINGFATAIGTCTDGGGNVIGS